MLTGDSYKIELQIMNGRQPLELTSVSLIEFSVGKIKKLYPGDVTYLNGIFSVPLTQSETFRLKKQEQIQARVKFTNNSVIGCDFGTIEVKESLSRAII